MSRVIFTVVLAAVVFAATSAQANPDCGQYNDCYSCTNSYSGDCGWNDQYQTCSRGDAATGYPIGYDYTPNWWAWKTDRCCSQSYSCTSCTQVYDNRCGWNPGQSSCQWSGNDNDGSQISEEYLCPSQLNCDYNWDCSSCLDSTNCGWDRNEQTCMAGNSNGPYNGWSYSWHYDNCPDRAWDWDWRASSVPMWLTVFGVFGCCFCLCACSAGRRRRRILREQNRQAALGGGNTTANASAPLMGQPVYQPQPPVQNLYGPGAAYTAQPAPTSYGTAPTAAPVNAVPPFGGPAPTAQPINLYGPADDTPQVEDCTGVTKP